MKWQLYTRNWHLNFRSFSVVDYVGLIDDIKFIFWYCYLCELIWPLGIIGINNGGQLKHWGRVQSHDIYMWKDVFGFLDAHSMALNHYNHISIYIINIVSLVLKKIIIIHVLIFRAIITHTHTPLDLL